MGVLLLVIVIGSSIWVAVDASNIDYPRGGRGALDMSPAGWCLACLLVWIVAFPCYLVKRTDLQRQADIARQPVHGAGGSAAATTAAGPPPGYWQASNGQWYPPHSAPAVATGSPGPGYWKADDGHWYPPTITPPAPNVDPEPS